MNKKEYIKPTAHAITVLNQRILDSSVPVSGGNTSEQDAKESVSFSFEDDEEY